MGHVHLSHLSYNFLSAVHKFFNNPISDGAVLLFGESVRRVGATRSEPGVLGGKERGLYRTLPADYCRARTQVSNINKLTIEFVQLQPPILSSFKF